MAAGRLPAPGTELGPCVPSCGHTDCAETRTMAATSCFLCGKPIGYETSLYQEPDKRLVHAACMEERHG